MNRITNPQRDKRAYVAYLTELIRKQKEGQTSLQDGTSLTYEISRVELHLHDLDILIEVNDNQMN